MHLMLGITLGIAVELSCKSEYALLALMALSDHSEAGEPLQIRQISADQKIPDRYLEQLLGTLRHGGIVRSQRGAKGGYFLARSPWQITLLEVITCIEGDDLSSQQERSPKNSAEKTVVQSLWQDVRESMRQVLQNCTIQDLCEQRDNLRQAELMYYI